MVPWTVSSLSRMNFETKNFLLRSLFCIASRGPVRSVSVASRAVLGSGDCHECHKQAQKKYRDTHVTVKKQAEARA